jgi:hypothetical protein
MPDPTCPQRAANVSFRCNPVCGGQNLWARSTRQTEADRY